jgi:type II secretory pathway component PulF
MDSLFPTFRHFIRSSGSFRTWWPLFSTATQRQALLRLIAVATEQHLPLLPLLESWTSDERGPQRRRLTKLCRLLREGRPLVEALELVPGVLREEDLLAIRFDAQTGTRTAAMREALASGKSGERDFAPRLERAIIYFCVLVPIGLLLVAFTQLKVLPVLGHIFREFGAPAPPALAWSLSSSGIVLIYLPLASIVLIVFLGWLLATRSGRPFRQALFGRLRWPWHEQRAAGVLQTLAVAAQAGRPIPGAVSTLARYHYDPAIRRDLLFVRNEIEQGAGDWQSLATVGLLAPSEAELLQSAPASTDLAWMLRQLVDAKRRRTARRTQWVAELAMPLLVFAMASLVVFQALTVFQPLARIIDHLN